MTKQVWLCHDCTIYACNADLSGCGSDERAEQVETAVNELMPLALDDHKISVREDATCDCCGVQMCERLTRFTQGKIKPVKVKERKHDYTNAVSNMRSVIARVAREKLSHDRMLDMRSTEVFETESYKRLTATHKAEICTMTSAATDAWHACGAIVWTHEVNGKIVVSLSEDYDVNAIDTTKSRHRWANGFNVWYEGK